MKMTERDIKRLDLKSRTPEEAKHSLVKGQEREVAFAKKLTKHMSEESSEYTVYPIMLNEENQGLVLNKKTKDRGDCILVFQAAGAVPAEIRCEIKINPYTAGKSLHRTILKEEALSAIINNKAKMLWVRYDRSDRAWMKVMDYTELEIIKNTYTFVPYKELSPNINSDKDATELFHNDFSGWICLNDSKTPTEDIDQIIAEILK